MWVQSYLGNDRLLMVDVAVRDHGLHVDKVHVFGVGDDAV